MVIGGLFGYTNLILFMRGFRGGSAGGPPPNGGYCSAKAERCEQSVAATLDMRGGEGTAVILEGGPPPNGGNYVR